MLHDTELDRCHLAGFIPFHDECIKKRTAGEEAEIDIDTKRKIIHYKSL